MVGVAKQDARVTCSASEKWQDQGVPVRRCLLDSVGCAGWPSSNSDKRWWDIRGDVEKALRNAKGVEHCRQTALGGY